MTDSRDWTPLPVAKWTPSSILKLHDQLLSKFMKDILENKKHSRHEKNKRVANAVQWIQLIHNYTISGQMTYKKEEDVNRKS